jgi:hypothetical protein
MLHATVFITANCRVILTDAIWRIIGVWPSGKAHGFGPCIRGFESLHPSQVKSPEPLGFGLFTLFAAGWNSHAWVRLTVKFFQNFLRARLSSGV